MLFTSSLRHKLVTLWFCLFTCFSASGSNAVTIGIPEELSGSLRYVDGELEGLLSSHYSCVMNLSGLDYSYRILPHARVISSLKNGRIDVGIPLVQTQGRNHFALYVSELITARFEVAVDDESEVRSVEDIKHLMSSSAIAVKRGTAVKEVLLNVVGLPEAEHGVQFLEMNTWEGALAFIQRGRGEATVLPTLVKEQMPAEVLQGLRFLQIGSASISSYVSKKAANAEVIQAQLNSGVQACRKTNLNFTY